MKIATILVSAAMALAPGLALAQSTSGGVADKPNHVEAVRMPHAAGAASSRNPNNSDRAIDAELKRIDRMMTICNGC